MLCWDPSKPNNHNEILYAFESTKTKQNRKTKNVSIKLMPIPQTTRDHCYDNKPYIFFGQKCKKRKKRNLQPGTLNWIYLLVRISSFGINCCYLVVKLARQRSLAIIYCCDFIINYCFVAMQLCD